MSVLKYLNRGTKLKLMAGEFVQWVDGHKTKSRYIRACVLSYPLWTERKDYLPLWEECRRLEVATGEPYVIDHIIPLNHPLVCGLSVTWNMVAIPARVNARKGNKWFPDQLELF